MSGASRALGETLGRDSEEDRCALSLFPWFVAHLLPGLSEDGARGVLTPWSHHMTSWSSVQREGGSESPSWGAMTHAGKPPPAVGHSSECLLGVCCLPGQVKKEAGPRGKWGGEPEPHSQ